MRDLGRPIDPDISLRGGLGYRIDGWGTECHFSALICLTALDLDYRGWRLGGKPGQLLIYRELRKRHAAR